MTVLSLLHSYFNEPYENVSLDGVIITYTHFSVTVVTRFEFGHKPILLDVK